MTTTTADVFTGWPADATAFLAELAEANDQEFWAAQRHRYDACVLPPLRALAAALEGEFGAMRVFRPYRDRRFRPDAPPYRTDAGGVVATPRGSEYSVVLSATALSVQVGRYAFDGPQLRAFRAAVAERGAELRVVLDGLAATGLALGAIPTLQSRPRGIPADHPQLELLRLKGMYVGASWPVGEWLSRSEPLGRVAGAWRAARPLVEWLDAHV